MRTSPASLGVRPLQGCQGGCHYLWIVRVDKVVELVGGGSVILLNTMNCDKPEK